MGSFALRGWTATTLAALVAGCSEPDIAPVETSDPSPAVAFAGEVRGRFLRAESDGVPVVLPDAVEHIDLVAGGFVPRLASPTERVRLPVHASGPIEVREPSGMGLRFSLDGARDVAGEIAGGLVVHRGVLGDGVDWIHRPGPRGTEDHLLFERAPRIPEVAYEVDVSAAAGLRLVAGVLELLDAGGTPRLRVAAPLLVEARGEGSAGRAHVPELAVEGCRFDVDPRPPWARPVVAPGAARCRVVVSWDAAVVRYPALLDPAWSFTSDMIEWRSSFDAVRLADGRVLAAGGPNRKTAELFDPATKTWAATSDMAVVHNAHTATLLENGRVLVAGGSQLSASAIKNAELYDPATGQWSAAKQMSNGHAGHTAHRLADGTVLVLGGWDGSAPIDSAERYDPASNTWTSTQPMVRGRFGHTSTLLGDGRVLAAGGGANPDGPKTAEIYDPATNAWSATASLVASRSSHLASALPDGRALVVGGLYLSAEIYDPAADTWTLTASTPLHTNQGGAAALLPSGRVILSGGGDADGTAVQLFDPVTEFFVPAEPMAVSRGFHSATVLESGALLVSGGADDFSKKAEIFELGPLGASCGGAEDCTSGFCVDGVCCDSACDAPCLACTQGLKGSGTSGECGPVASGSDPKAGCAAQPPETCGAIGAGCDGAGSCKVHPAGTVCGEPACEDAVATTSSCDGEGTCAPEPVQCAPFGCDGTECSTACSGDGDCAESGFCDPATGTCDNDQDDGAACERPEQCASGTCLGGTCVSLGGCLDDQTQIDEQGGEVACAPYACGPSGCYTQCDSIQQCAPPNVCRGDGTCGGSKASGDDGGCSVEPAPSDSSPLLLVGLLLLRRRRRVCAR